MSIHRGPRRAFLRNTATVSAGLSCLGSVGIAGCGGSRPSLSERQRAVVPVAETYFAPEAADARRIGEQHLAQTKPSQRALDTMLAPTVERIEEAGSKAAALEALDGALRRDFEELRIFDVGGWTLGRTEVGLAVLVALDPGP